MSKKKKYEDGIYTDGKTWRCGDCGTDWPISVMFCENKLADQMAVTRYSEGYRKGIQESGNVVKELLEAIKLLNSYGLGVTSLEKK